MPNRLATNFSKNQRLFSAKDFQRVFDQVTIKTSNKDFLCLSRSNDQGNARLGLIVAKKHIRQAVQRNRVKRVVRESFRHQAFLPASDIIIMVRRNLNDTSNADLFFSLQRIWTDLEKRSHGLRTASHVPS